MRHTRKDVVARTRREFAALDRLVRRLRPADWTRRVPRPPTRDPWTVKDALAHILYWKEHTTRVIRGEKRLPEMRGLDVEAMNRLIYERWRARPPAELRQWHRRVHDDVLGTLRKTPEEWFGRRERSAEWPLDFDGHSAAHRMKDIEAALAEPSPSTKRSPSAGRRPNAGRVRVPGGGGRSRGSAGGRRPGAAPARARPGRY